MGYKEKPPDDIGLVVIPGEEKIDKQEKQVPAKVKGFVSGAYSVEATIKDVVHGVGNMEIYFDYKVLKNGKPVEIIKKSVKNKLYTGGNK